MTFLIYQLARAQNRSVSGKVTSGSGELLPGENVLLQGTSTDTVTNIYGEYRINVSSSDA